MKDIKEIDTVQLTALLYKVKEDCERIQEEIGFNPGAALSGGMTAVAQHESEMKRRFPDKMKELEEKLNLKLDIYSELIKRGAHPNQN